MNKIDSANNLLKQNTNIQKVNYFSSIPKEILLIIFSQLDILSLGRTQSVCKRFKILAQEESLWKRFDEDCNPLSSKKTVIQNWQFKNAAKKEQLLCIQTLTGHINWVTSLLLGEKILFSGSMDETIGIWMQEGNKWKFSTPLTGAFGVVNSFSYADEKVFAGSNFNKISVLELNKNNKKWECTQTLETYSDGVTDLCYAKERLFSGSWDATIKVWKQENKEWECTQILLGHDDAVHTLCYADDKLFSGSKDKTIRVWEEEKGEWKESHNLEGHQDSVTSIRYANGVLFSGSKDKTIKIWKFEKKQWNCIQTLLKHTKGILTLFYAKEMLFSGSSDMTIKVWALNSQDKWELAQSLCGHSNLVKSVSYKNGMLFSGSWDTKIKVWSYPTELGESTKKKQVV